MKKTIVMAGMALAALGVSATGAAAQDVAAGEKIAKRCIACHTFEEGGANKVGPNLFGVTERAPGTAEGFKYSKGFQAAVDAGMTWDDANLMAYLEDPTAHLREVSGDSSARSKMTFKLKPEDDRQNVIAYMKTLK
ncbi:c-type cytochrome [Caenispirillum salinarum]|uniref:c-type cytochrome n=1 Tax=Caenispirillum salinarum TaxID=859058 RepID=UPI003850093B